MDSEDAEMEEEFTWASPCAQKFGARCNGLISFYIWAAHFAIIIWFQLSLTTKQLIFEIEEHVVLPCTQEKRDFWDVATRRLISHVASRQHRQTAACDTSLRFVLILFNPAS